MRLGPLLFLLVISTEVLPSRVDLYLSSAIKIILDHNFADSSGKVDFILCGSKYGPSQDLFNHILRILDNSLSIQVASCEIDEVLLNTSSILIFDSPECYKEILPKISWQRNKSRRLRHLVQITNGTLQNVNESVTDGWSIDNTAFLVDETEKSISLVTSFMFTNKKCWENQLVTINRFEKQTMRWESDDFFPSKYRNFHSCALHKNIGTNDTGKGLFDEIVTELSVILNFAITTSYIESLTEFEILKKPTDLIKVIAGLEYSNEYIQVVVSSEQGVYIIPNGEPLTHLQKFLLPFDSATWFFIILTLTTILVLIQIASFASARIKTLCFGSNFESPTMNLMNVFLCGGQAQDPQNYFSRYMFLLVLMWSLIIRTSFQSLSYRTLQLDTRHPPMRTFDDLREHNFLQFIVTRPNGIVPAEELRSTWYSIPATHFVPSMSVFQIIVEPVNKRTMQLSMDYIEMLERRYFRSGKSSLAFLDEDIRSLTITFPMLPFNPFYEEFEEKIQRLIEAGTCPKRLIGRIVASTSENKRFNEDVPPLVLTLDDLGIGFVACLVPLGLSIIVFVIEISASKLRQLQNYLKAVFR